MIFADTNIFIHYLVKPRDVASEKKSLACQHLFDRVIKGNEEITTSESVITEIVYVLQSRRLFALEPAEISARLKPILSLSGLKLRDKRSMLRALDIYASHPTLDIEDALSAVYVERIQPPVMYSYDRDFDQLESIERREPAF